MEKAVFLDRDGTINHDFGYLRDPEKVRLLPNVAKALKILLNDHWQLIIVSNQSGIGRGFYTEDQLHCVQNKVESDLESKGVNITGFYYCPHSPEQQCDCRKPKPGLLLLAAEEKNVDLSASWMIGDKISDVTAGITAGCRSILISPDAHISAEYIVKPDLLSAANHIVGQKFKYE